jgi:hypothetical protein
MRMHVYTHGHTQVFLRYQGGMSLQYQCTRLYVYACVNMYICTYACIFEPIRTVCMILVICMYHSVCLFCLCNTCMCAKHMFNACTYVCVICTYMRMTFIQKHLHAYFVCVICVHNLPFLHACTLLSDLYVFLCVCPLCNHMPCFPVFYTSLCISECVACTLFLHMYF